MRLFFPREEVLIDATSAESIIDINCSTNLKAATHPNGVTSATATIHVKTVSLTKTTTDIENSMTMRLPNLAIKR